LIVREIQSRRQPADNADLPAGFAALPAVGEKVIGSAARAGADIMGLLSACSLIHLGARQDLTIAAEHTVQSQPNKTVDETLTQWGPG